MGTNYYVTDNHCECCSRYDEIYHIGKSSYGWAFSFRGYKVDNGYLDNLRSWQEWKVFLKNRNITNEYGERVSCEEFVKMIEGEKHPNYVREDGHKNLVHNEQGRIPDKNGFTWFNPEYDWDDVEGFSFCSREFS